MLLQILHSGLLIASVTFHVIVGSNHAHTSSKWAASTGQSGLTWPSRNMRWRILLVDWCAGVKLVVLQQHTLPTLHELMQDDKAKEKRAKAVGYPRYTTTHVRKTSCAQDQAREKAIRDKQRESAPCMNFSLSLLDTFSK